MPVSKKRVTRKKKPQPVLIVKPPPAGSADRLEFARKIREQLRASQTAPDSRSAS